MTNEHDELRHLANTLRRENSWQRRFWAGVLFGIGASIGVAAILYVAVLLAQQLQHLPLVGQYFDKVTPALEKALEDKVPNVTSKTEEAPKQETPAGTISGSTKLSTNYFRLTLPAGWDVKVNQTSTSDEKLKIVAETDDYAETAGAQFTVSVLDATSDPGEPVEAVETEMVTVDGVEGKLWRYTDGQTGLTETRYVQIEHDNLIFTLALSYRADNYPNSAAVFDDILTNFEFKN